MEFKTELGWVGGLSVGWATAVTLSCYCSDSRTALVGLTLFTLYLVVRGAVKA